MDPASAVALAAAVLNCGSGFTFVAIARAPGWRIGRLFAVIAFSAGMYNLASLALCLPGRPDVFYLTAGRLAYLVGTLHCAAWVIYAFGNLEGTVHSVPRRLRWAIGAFLAAGLMFAVTGWHLQPSIAVVNIGWAGVVYHYPLTTRLGDVYGLLLPLVLGAVFLKLLHRYRAGERALRWHLAGFILFFLCALDEVLVANRVIAFLSLADVGFLFVVIPLTLQVIHRITLDARRLQQLSVDLEAEVQRRTRERDEARAALTEAERLASLGRLAAGVGHEINNPLSYLQLALEEVRTHLRQTQAPPVIQQSLADAEDGALRVQKVVEGLRSYSRATGTLARIHPHDVARTALKVAGPQLRHLSPVVLDLQPCPEVLGDEPRLVQALINLLVNAAQALRQNPQTSRITLRTTTSAEGDVLLSVEDNGPGIPPEHLNRVSEPYFTTRTSSGGLGLGLFITRGIMDCHGGRLEFSSSVGRGTRATLRLPPAPPTTAPTAAVALPEKTPMIGSPPLPVPSAPLAGLQAAGRSNRGRLLLVDDEPALLKVLGRHLGRSWDVTTATNGLEALDYVASRPFDVVLCDLMMPGMSGMEFADRLAACSPELRARTLFLTGGAVTQASQEFLERTDVRHCEKPIDMARLDSLLSAMKAEGPARTQAGRTA